MMTTTTKDTKVTFPKRGGDCDYTMDCPWGIDGWCDRPETHKCVMENMSKEELDYISMTSC